MAIGTMVLEKFAPGGYRLGVAFERIFSCPRLFRNLRQSRICNPICPFIATFFLCDGKGSKEKDADTSANREAARKEKDETQSQGRPPNIRATISRKPLNSRDTPHRNRSR